jgi:hypothetical protein
MTVDMTNNRVPYGLLTDEEKAALHEHEKAGGGFLYTTVSDTYWRIACEKSRWYPNYAYRTVPLPAQRSEQNTFRDGWVFAFKQWERTGSVPNPDCTTEQKTQDVIAWDRLPDWVEWVARWSDHTVWGFKGEPAMGSVGWYGTKALRIDDFPGLVQIGTCDWKDSKQRRPRG